VCCYRYCRSLVVYLPTGLTEALSRSDSLGSFGDGELLVLAVVIAAAGIGDLVFSARAGRSARLRDAIVVSIALVVVTLSALVFGLVTLKRESGGSLRITAGATANALSAQAATLEAQAADKRSQATELLLKYNAEVTGQATPGTTAVAGAGAEAALLRDQLEQGLKAGGEAQMKADAVKKQSAAATQMVAKSTNADSEQAAAASVILYVVSLFAGGLCVYFSSGGSQPADR